MLQAIAPPHPRLTRLAAWAFLSLVSVGGASAQATGAARVITVGQLVQDTLESEDEVNEYQIRGK